MVRAFLKRIQQSWEGFGRQGGVPWPSPTRVSERVDASPVLVTHLDRRELLLVDRYCPTHGKGVGRSLGQVSGLWSMPGLFEGDYRLNRVAHGPNHGATRTSATTVWPQCCRP